MAPAQAGSPDYEAEMLHRSGQRIPVVVSVSPLELQGRDLRLGIFRDITERKRAGQRLAIQHEVTRMLAESAFGREAFEKLLAMICEKLGWAVAEIWTLDPTNNVLRCGGLWHKPGPELAGFKDSIGPMTFARGADLPGRVWETGQPEWMVDVELEPGFTRADAAKRAGLHSAVAIPVKSKGAVTGVLELFDGQTRPLDAQLLQLFETVCTQIGQFLERRQIEEQLRQAQKMEAVGQLAGGVAHDFNNLLSIIAGHAHVLLMDNGLGADHLDSAKQISTAALRAAELTRQLLAFSRKQVLHVHPVVMNDTIANVTRMLQRVIGEDIRLEQHLARELPVIQADEGMIEQVLLNLVVNARDAMPRGGRLVIRTDAVKLDQDYTRQNPEASAGDFVRLTVSDSGCGIPPEVLPHIFEPFFTTKEVGKGTGLGLATVYGIARQHNGWVEVKSKAETGTDFSVYLPVSSQLASERIPEEESQILGGNETIFLVEDDAAVRGTARHILRRYGYKVIEAISGAEALKRWSELQGKVDLVLTDIVMPDGVTGRELADQLRAQQPDLKVIFTSGYTVDSDPAKTEFREGINFLQKPYPIRALAKVVRDCLDGKS
jgi:signal transduction histidine kinase